ncbi:MAG TPA: hypothetical protein VFS43_44900 [Polyangiaceae bacterium]|nr:hypothetical protein [Polyangiaceae bacterium]
MALSACAGPGAAGEGRAPAAGRAPAFGEPEVRALDGRPPLAVLRREGDPRPALAAAVAVEGPPGASEALAALVEGRLARALPRASVTADRLGYRVRVAIEGEAEVDRALEALRRALVEPVLAAEAPAALERVRAKRGRALDDEAAVALARCTGEARYGAAEFAALEAALASPGALEGWRRRAHGVGAVALGATGPERFARRAEARLGASAPWPSVAPPRDPWPPEAPPEALVRSGREPIARVELAIRLADRRLAATVAEELGARPSALAARLRALPQPFALREVRLSVRPAGACLSLRAEGEHAPSSGAKAPEEAGAAAGLLRHEVRAIAGSVRVDPGALPRQIRSLGDAREAAEAAAWWALSAEGPPRAREATAAALTLPAGGEGAAPLASTEAASARERELARRFDEATASALAAWSRPAVEVRGAVERGQGELWVLLASTCPIVENASEAGTTALGATAVALAAPREGGVSVEPWVSAEGAGVLAHAPPASNEGPAALAERVATAAARSLAEIEPRADEVARARSLLLGRIEERDEHVRGAIAEQLLPSHAAAWFPWGLAGSLGRVGPEAVRVRWRRLAAGPLRLAVLAGGGPEQLRAAGLAVERWAAHGEAAATCPPREEAPAAGAGRYAGFALGARGARAYVALPVEASTGPARAALRATLVLLGPEGGLLGRALGGVGARGEAFLVGAERGPLLVIELRGSEDALEGAVAQVRALLERLRRGALAAADLERVRGPLGAAWLEARSSPRRRLVDLWRGGGDERPEPTLEGWRQWLGSGFFDDRAAVVVVKAPGE